uniref:FIIND domain-containing protein n=1 Tax=Astyanax mexicanus TaxID=7994 RepID=A0A3B1JAP4_ASTMX
MEKSGVEKSTKLVKEQMSLSVTLCPPGPHCLLLVIRVDSIFKSKQRNALEGHLKLFPETVWNHTMVLFSFGEYLEDTTIEQYIESEGKDLQWLVEKCGNRYHVLNIWNKDKDTQVSELLEKIEEMVAANSGCCYVINKKILQEVEEKRRQQKDMQAKQVTSVLRIGLQGTPVEQFIESKGKDLQWLVEKCGNRYHVLNNMNRSDTTQVTELLEKIEEMVAANSGHCFEMGRKIVQEDEETSREDAEKSHNQKTLLGHCEENLWTDAEGFVPKMREHKTNNYHRFQCPHAGRFQCRLTNLVFEMEGKGEVLYRIDSWDTNVLDGLGQMKSAGPLYDIDCFEGSINYLYFPHCEILTDQAELAVAHFTSGNLEIIEPLEVTNTHVIIAIRDLSIFALISKIFFAGPINAQVLFFYKPVTGVQNLREMHIHLLPGNVPLTEVKNQYLDFTNVRTSSKCQLTPGRKYKASCGPYVPQPQVETFERDHGPNYHPAFVVHVESVRITVSLLDENGMEVWEPHQFFLTGGNTDLLNMNTDAEFVNKYRQKLIKRVSSVMEIADCLKSKQMITDEMYSDIQAAKTSHEQMRLLYRALDSGGAAVKVEFYNILKEKQPFLVDDLEAGPSEA